MKKQEIIERIITKYNGKTYNSNDEFMNYLRNLLDAELTGYSSDYNVVKKCPKCHIDMHSVENYWLCIDCFFKIIK